MNGYLGTAVILLAAALIRLSVIPKFTIVPGRFQLILEQCVSAIDALGGALLRLGRALKAAVIALFRTRVGHAIVDGKKVRACKKCGATL